MKHQTELRDPAALARLTAAVAEATTRPWRIMEVCGGQTHALVRFGIDQLLPPEITLLHGPGCPVCVTPVAVLDEALALAARPGLIFCSFGDMLRVPGSDGDLRRARAAGADVRVLYSPLDALAVAEENPAREVVFFAVGFETTAPGIAATVLEARARGIRNFSVLVSHVRVPPALEALLDSPDRGMDGFLAAGHVATIMGEEEYRPISARYRVPIVITGFEPIDLLVGILACVRQLEEGRAEVENAYARVARPDGNPAAKAMLRQVFEVVSQTWRGLGPIPSSGLALRAEFADFDAHRRFPSPPLLGREDPECQAGLVLQGRLQPPQCPAFGTRCTPDTPLGAPMVSSEGACAAWHRYRRLNWSP